MQNVQQVHSLSPFTITGSRSSLRPSQAFKPFLLSVSLFFWYTVTAGPYLTTSTHFLGFPARVESALPACMARTAAAGTSHGLL